MSVKKRANRKATQLIIRVANNIKHYRKKMKFTQEKLENETGLAVPRYE